MSKKKEIMRTIKNFERILKSGNVKTVLTVSDWDIYAKTHTIEEIAARFLRIKGYSVQITISDNTERPSYLFGYIRSYRYARIKFNSNWKRDECKRPEKTMQSWIYNPASP